LQYSNAKSRELADPAMGRDFQQIEWDPQLEAVCRQIIRAAVLEDLDIGYDWTTVALASSEAMGKATVFSRRAGVIAGLPCAALVCDEMDKRLRFSPLVKDGARVDSAQPIAELIGPVRSLLAAERIVLNFLCRLSGIASFTNQFVEAVAGTGARIYDTRKTTPGWRRVEKYAVRCGGGNNHRTGLFDAVLIKDNHVGFLAAGGPRVNSAAEAVEAARGFLETTFAEDPRSKMIIEVEVDRLDQLPAVLDARPDIVLLDNMTPDELRAAVGLRDAAAPGVELEASGGVNLQTVRAIARTGVNRISVGSLTHSAPALDLSLDWIAG
jgi:nicotinate-nucleotide pyrophosphorylase (carboxylating)